MLTGRWCNVAFLNVHAPREGKTDDSKHCFYVELEQIILKIPNLDMKILRGYFNAKMERGDIFKPKLGNEILHQ